MQRRDFLVGATAAGVLAACGAPSAPSSATLSVSGANLALGHRLRKTGAHSGADFPAPTETRHVDVAVVGGGIGGLAAAWRLAREGVDDFLLVELETDLGGNSRAGHNAVSAFPLGAHYLPLPPREAIAVRELLRELGALHGDGSRLADYEETLIAAAPQERLFIDGWWQEGLWPTHRVPANERAQYARFQAFVGELRTTRDVHGRRPFALPMELSATSDEWRALDRMSFRDWLQRESYSAPGLHWLANYATRDDYGTDYTQTSAWAGLHYFGCRGDGKESDLEGHMLTTPGGNAWLAEGLGRCLKGTGAQRVIYPALAYRVEENREGVVCDIYLAAENRSVRVQAKALIWAAPLFLIPHTFVNPLPAWQELAQRTEYAPWVVVNLTLAAPLMQRTGSPLAWDNVIYGSDSLGYVVATHQAMRYAPGPTVLTWYRALHEPTHYGPTVPSRQHRLFETDPHYWAEVALNDLARPHPEIRELVTQIHVHSHGHAMIRPVPGTIWDPARTAIKRGSRRIHFAHADVSGLSLFEEAMHRGVLAAENTLRRFGLRVGNALG
jgi:monoamine oxidase